MSVVRLLALLVLFAAQWFIGRAEAACTPYSPGSTSAYCDTEGEAYAWVASHVPVPSGPGAGCSKDKWTNIKQEKRVEGEWLTTYSHPEGCGYPLDGNMYSAAGYPVENSCASKPNGTIPAEHYPGTVQCVNNCARKVFPSGDGNSWYDYTGQTCDSKPEDCTKLSTTGVHYVWNQYFQHCQPVTPECPEGKVSQNNQCVDKPDCPAGQFLDGQGICQNKKEECPAGQIKSPEGNCLPGDGQCAAGEARRPNGTCGKDDDGDGKPDDDDDNPENDSEKGEFSGGDSCQNPPTCNGDAILCGQARIQWRIDCNTRKSRNISGGTCDRVPTCTGEKCDAMEYSSLLMQWRTACAVEKLKNSSGGQPGNEGQPDWTKVTGDGNNAGEDPDNPHKSVEMNLDGRLDHSGFFSGSGSCPQLGTVQTYFGPVNLDEVTWFCDLLTLTNYILKFVGGFIALGILMGWRFG